MIRWEIFIFLIRESDKLQIHARDIKKILNVSDGIVKLCHTHSEVDCISDNDEFYNAMQYMGQRKGRV